MAILLAFMPFLVFAVLRQPVGTEPALLAATATSLALLARDTLIRRRTAKVLEVGTALLFAALAIAEATIGAGWSVAAVRLAVDGGLLLIVLISMAIGQPFTLQYARESVPEAYWNLPEFRRTNYVITAAWAAAFAIMAATDLAWLLVPTLPPRVVIIATVLSLVAAVKFTGWYPDRQRTSQATGAGRV